MKREDFIKIIKLRSCWKINKKIGNYKLPNETKLSDYIKMLVLSQMKIDNLGIEENGDLSYCVGGEWNEETKTFNDYIIMPDFKLNENCSYNEMERRISRLIYEIVG